MACLIYMQGRTSRFLNAPRLMSPCHRARMYGTGQPRTDNGGRQSTLGKPKNKIHRRNQCCIPVLYGSLKVAVGGFSSSHSTIKSPVRQRSNRHKTISNDANEIFDESEESRIKDKSQQKFQGEESRLGHPSEKSLRGHTNAVLTH